MKYRLEFHTDAVKEYAEAYEWYEIKRQGLGGKIFDISKTSNRSDRRTTFHIWRTI